jgi:hypothetical protein
MDNKDKNTLIIISIVIAILCIGIICVGVVLITGVGIWSWSEPVEPLPEIEATTEVEATADVAPQPSEQASTPETTPVPVPEVVAMTPFQDPNGFYSLSYPKDWKVKKSGSEQQFCADPEGNICLAVSIHIKSLSTRNLADDIALILNENLDNYQELSREDTFFAGLPAILVEQAFNWNGTPKRGYANYTVRNRVGYSIMGWAPEYSFSQWEPILRDISQSFEITDYAEAPLYEDWLFYESEHTTFYYLPGTWIEGFIEGIASDHEWAFDQIQETLDVNHNGIITYFLYPSVIALYRSTAREFGFAINKGGEVHALWVSVDDHQSLGHEMTHVITHWTIGDPSEALMGEGIAVCLDQSGRDYQEVGRQMVSEGRWVTLPELLGEAWFDIDPEIAYPQSGCFACYLLEKYDLESFKKLYTAPDFESGVNQVLNTNLQQLEADWLAWLGEN